MSSSLELPLNIKLYLEGWKGSCTCKCKHSINLTRSTELSNIVGGFILETSRHLHLLPCQTLKHVLHIASNTHAVRSLPPSLAALVHYEVGAWL